MRQLGFAAAFAVFIFAGTAHAQSAPPASGPIGSVPSSPQPNVMEFRGPDERATEFGRLNNEVSRAKPGPTRSATPIPASPEDVTVGTKVRDSRGVLMGTIDRAAMGYAVVETPVGKVEVDYPSFAKNKKGLLINMTKAKFYKLVKGDKE